MPGLWLVLIVLALAVIGYVIGRGRALQSGGGDSRNLHSLPSFYGWNVAVKVLIPAFLLLSIWSIVQPILVENAVSDMIPQEAISADLEDDERAAAQMRAKAEHSLRIAEMRRTADGLSNTVAEGIMTEDEAQNLRADFTDVTQRLKNAGQVVTSQVTQPMLSAAQRFRILDQQASMFKSIAVIALALAAMAYGVLQSKADFRARNAVETTIRGILIATACIAILTTVGIVLSLVFNTIEFFRIYNWTDYLFGTTWSPRSGAGTHQPLGLLPLLWGTLYISIIALIVAVPIGLFAAIYLSEYASQRLRGFVKPALEVLAGIPSIVYGLFALITVGPMLMNFFGSSGLGIMPGARSVMTAGLVMGIMLIPFVSSLSDDIINAVPQYLRDGSYGLGATKSETIKQVIVPAALPGIVGAIILAASRAIGETMLVVFGAGAAGKLSGNPFEAMTTVTAKIVSQLTGDADFTQPEVLVAYALGTTLFILTLSLNFIAQRIVNKYREQY